MTKRLYPRSIQTLVDGEAYCRRCRNILPIKEFYDAVDGGLIDSNLHLSICKECIDIIFEEELKTTNNFEKSIHKLCILLNVRFSQSAIEAAQKDVEGRIEKGQETRQFFGVYKSRLVSEIESMDKSNPGAMMYEDTATVYVTKDVSADTSLISKDLRKKWGDNYSYNEVLYLESQFMDAKTTHSAETWAEVTLLKEACYKLLEIKKSREKPDPEPTGEAVKELQGIMKSLSISPSAINAGTNPKGTAIMGKAIEVMEQYEPAQWLAKDGKKFEMYRDVSNVEEYYQKYFVRPLKNFITGSKDFNVDEEIESDDEFTGIDTSVEE